jgi:hypothetical protein
MNYFRMGLNGMVRDLIREGVFFGLCIPGIHYFLAFFCFMKQTTYL